MTTLFISDLHLEAARPEIGAQFVQFLQDEAATADALYILGDLFESWVGDDDPNPHYADMKRELKALSDRGVPLYFMHGNRDFLIGETFAQETGAELLVDPLVREIHGERVLLSHGDAWCTDDLEYQAARLMTRNPDWQATMLAKSLEERLAFAAQARNDSAARGATLDERISDVNPESIAQVMHEHDVRTMLHGHTHRPDVHRLEVDGEPATRIVLGDWYEQGSVVRWDAAGPRLEALPRRTSAG
ncbi:MAG: UDP-2,3-diacylglucosamine diphosphatase [Woeseiaceae bacterium]|nr:UDP-2,3-diacylglucosamine diphosphatase [Woeseiaceae bacterium]